VAALLGLLFVPAALGQAEAGSPETDGQLENAPCPPTSPSTHPYVRRLRGQTAACTALAFSQDGSRLVAGHADGSLSVWDPFAEGPEPTFLTPSHGSAVAAVAFTPNGSHLVSASTDGSIRFWDAATLDAAATLIIPGGTATGLAISPDGGQLAVGADTGSVFLWDLQRGLATSTAPSSTLYATSGIESLTYRPGSTPLLWTGLSNGLLQLWNPPSARALEGLETHGGPVAALAVREGDPAVPVYGSQNGSVVLWGDYTPNSGRCEWGFATAVEDLALGPHGEWIVVGLEDGSINLLRVEPCAFVSGIVRFMDPITSVAFHPCGRSIACASSGGYIALVSLDGFMSP